MHSRHIGSGNTTSIILKLTGVEHRTLSCRQSTHEFHASLKCMQRILHCHLSLLSLLHALASERTSTLPARIALLASFRQCMQVRYDTWYTKSRLLVEQSRRSLYLVQFLCRTIRAW
eukprot:scpid110193/ scgid16806/ 